LPPPTLKFRDDQPTLKFRDDGPSTLPQLDQRKQPQLDQAKSPVGDQPGFAQAGGGGAGPGGGRAAPFVLSTPHHSMAWTQTFPQSVEAAAAAYEQQITAYEQALSEYADAEAMGQLQPQDHQQAEALHQEYQTLIAEYWQQFGQ
jgi:hypothetical protein